MMPGPFENNSSFYTEVLHDHSIPSNILIVFRL